MPFAQEYEEERQAREDHERWMASQGPEPDPIEEYVRVAVEEARKEERENFANRIRDYYFCTCSPEYKDRNMIDPSCLGCDIETTLTEIMAATGGEGE